jgi:AAA family ATP:ADP antiporter
MKDPVFVSTVGMEYQPIAKVFSVLITLFVVCIYDFLTSLVSKPILFYIVSGFYGITFMIIAALLSDSDIGLENKNKSPQRLLGWIAYVTIESYGSLMVALFWSFTNSIMDLEQAKGAYGLIIS